MIAKVGPMVPSVTGRVAFHLLTALVDKQHRETTVDKRTLQFSLRGTPGEQFAMRVGAVCTQQGLEPSDFDNPDGMDAFTSILLMQPREVPPPRAKFSVTPAWRRVALAVADAAGEAA